MELNLTDMASLDANVLIDALATSHVIVAHWANGDKKILKGEDIIQEISASGQAQSVITLTLSLANNDQMHIIGAALMVIEENKMDAACKMKIWAMLSTASVIPNGPVVSYEPPPRRWKSDVRATTHYPNAEIRGQLRLWKQQLKRRYDQFDRNYHVARQGPIEAMIKKTGVGRRRAFDKLVRIFGPGLTLEALRLDGGDPLAVWSILKPRDSVRLNKKTGKPREDGAVCVHYVIAGLMQGTLTGKYGGISDGLWSLEVTDHALGRVLERTGTVIPLESIIAEAHHNLLLLDTNILYDDRLNSGRRFLVRAGDGGFSCEMSITRDVSVNEPMLYIRAATWIADDMTHDDQVILVANGEPGKRLVDGWLLPRPMRRVIPSEGKYQLLVWSVGLPDLLAAPKGHA